MRPFAFVSRTDIVIDSERDDRHCLIPVEHDAESIFEAVLFYIERLEFEGFSHRRPSRYAGTVSPAGRIGGGFKTGPCIAASNLIKTF